MSAVIIKEESHFTDMFGSIRRKCMLKVENVGHCELCGSKRNLEVHQYIWAPWLSKEEKDARTETIGL